MYLNLRDEAIVRISIDRDADAEFAQVCEENPDLRIEQDSDGEIIIMSPTGFRSSDRNAKILMHLCNWAEENGRGTVVESNVVFRLPDGSKRGPDAAWISNKKLNPFSSSELDDFLRVVPEFVIELRSKTDRIKDLHTKMAMWIKNGVELAWLIDAANRKVWIYTQNGVREELEPVVVLGEGPVAGFKLVMDKIYRGPLSGL